MNTPRTNAAPISGERVTDNDVAAMIVSLRDEADRSDKNGNNSDAEWFRAAASMIESRAAVSGERVREALPDIPPVGHPLQKLGAYLADILSEDRWLQAEALMLDVWNESAIPLAAQPETAGLALLYNVWCMHSQEQDDEWFYQWRQLMQAIELELSRSKYGPSLSAPVNAAQPEGK